MANAEAAAATAAATRTTAPRSRRETEQQAVFIQWLLAERIVAESAVHGLVEVLQGPPGRDEPNGKKKAGDGTVDGGHYWEGLGGEGGEEGEDEGEDEDGEGSGGDRYQANGSTGHQRPAFADFVAQVQQSLRPYDLSLRRSQTVTYGDDGDDEFGGEPVWAIVNVNGDGIAQLATEYTADDIEVFKRLVRMIARAPHFQASSIDAISTLAIKADSGSGRLMTASQTERLVESLVRARWITRRPSGLLAMGPRTLLELAPYLRSEADALGLAECRLCNDLIAVERPIHCRSCAAIFHAVCVRALAPLPLPPSLNRASHPTAPRPAQPVCPYCRTPFAAGDDGSCC